MKKDDLMKWRENTLPNNSAERMKNTEPQKPSLPDGKPNILWREGRGGWVCTTANRDLPGMKPSKCKSHAVEQVAENYGIDAARHFSRLLINT
jgi:hypothetical protein